MYPQSQKHKRHKRPQNLAYSSGSLLVDDIAVVVRFLPLEGKQALKFKRAKYRLTFLLAGQVNEALKLNSLLARHF